MKICYILPKFYGGEVPFFEYTQGLARHGHEVHALVTGREGEPRFEQVGNVQVERIAPDQSVSNQDFRFSFLQFLLDARQALDRQNGWDLINLRNLPGASMLPRFSRNRQSSVWVLEIQSPPLHGGWRSTISSYRIRLDARSFATTLVHAQEVAQDIFGSNSDRFVELPIGVDFDHFCPGKNPVLREKLGINPNEIVFIYTGTIRPIRRLHRVVLAFHLALQSVPNSHLLLVGEGHDVPRLKELAQSLGIASQVHFIGLVSYENMPAIMHASDISLGYVPQDPWFDKAPVLKTMEALACGLPTIATATQGNQKYITDGVNGILSGDMPDALASAMVKLASDQSLRARYSNGRKYIDSYQWKRIVNDILNPTYERLVTEAM
jgi:glycosyltransferase involved in cell wall biosynthesis